MLQCRARLSGLLLIGVLLGLAGCDPSSRAQTTDPAIAVQNAFASQPMNVPAANMDHSHIPVALPDGVPIPTLSISVSRDWMSGLNLKLHTENYEMTIPPAGLEMDALMQPSLNAETGIAEGHAHLYINGEKIQRIYGHQLHLPATLFKPGLNQINVSINNHGHMYWTANGRQILATLYVNLDAEALVTHRFETYPALSSNDGAMCTRDDVDKA